MTNDSALRIHGAIVKLQELLEASTPGPWEHCTHHPIALIESIRNGDEVAETLSGENADLIVTLHRTIGAQIAILQHGFMAYSQWDRHDEPLALALADAILGKD